MNEQKKQLLEKIKSSTNILVTVSANPSVDQLSACIGMTLVLNKLEKHATAVFSGQVPSTLEFLKPDKTLEKNTDSLRDFIIALDKSKADKLRYKLEDNVVKIFITPYRTSLTADDLDFSQGDFNVDMVIALGVHQQADLDQAITAHGRILHDATVTVINNEPGGELGSINWQDASASSLAEMVTDLVKGLGDDKPVFDQQVATALLTGIVAATDRFRNAKTSATTMGLSGELIAAGANQQLVADELEQELELPKAEPAESKPAETVPTETPEPEKPADPSGMLQIEHPKKPDQPVKAETVPAEPLQPAAVEAPELPDFMKAAIEPTPESPAAPPVQNDTELPTPVETEDESNESRPLITEAPSFGGSLTANVTPEHELPEPSIDPLGMSGSRPLLKRDSDEGQPEAQMLSKAASVEPPRPVEPALPEIAPKTSIPEPKFTEPPQKLVEPSIVAPLPPPEPVRAPMPNPQPVPPTPGAQPEALSLTPSFESPQDEPVHQTLTELEQANASTPVDVANASTDVTDVDSARDAVLKALNEQAADAAEPIAALNAQPLDLGPVGDPSVGQIQGLSFGGSATLPEPSVTPAPEPMPFATSPADQPLTMPTPPGLDLPSPSAAPPSADDPNAPPPVPPPMLPPFPPSA